MHRVLAFQQQGQLDLATHELEGYRQVRLELNVLSGVGGLDMKIAKTMLNLRLRLWSGTCPEQRLISFVTDNDTRLIESAWSTTAVSSIYYNYFTRYQPVYYLPLCPDATGLTLGASTPPLIGGHAQWFTLQASQPVFGSPGYTNDIRLRSANDDNIEDILPAGYVTYIDPYTVRVRIPYLSLGGRTFNPGSGRVCLIYNGKRIYAPNMVDIRYAVREDNVNKFPSGLDNTTDIPNTVKPTGLALTGCNDQVLSFQLHQSVVDNIPNIQTILTNILAEFRPYLKTNALVIDPTVSTVTVNDGVRAPVPNKILIYYGGNMTGSGAVMESSRLIDTAFAVIMSGGNEFRGIMRSGMIRINSDLFTLGRFSIPTTSSISDNQWTENGVSNFYATMRHEIGHLLGFGHCIDAMHNNSLTYSADNRQTMMYWIESAPYPVSVRSGRCENGSYPVNGSMCSKSMTQSSLAFPRDRFLNSINRFFNRKYGILSPNAGVNTPTFIGTQPTICSTYTTPQYITNLWSLQTGGGVGRGSFEKGTGGPTCNYITSIGRFAHCGAGNYPITYRIDGCQSDATISVTACRSCTSPNTIVIENATIDVCAVQNTIVPGFVDFQADITIGAGGSCPSSPTFGVFIVPFTGSFNFAAAPLVYSYNSIVKRVYFDIPASYGTGTYKLVVAYNPGASSQITSTEWVFNIQRVANANSPCGGINTLPSSQNGETTKEENQTEVIGNNTQQSPVSILNNEQVLSRNNSNNLSLQARLYPNPVSNILTISIQNTTEANPVIISIYDLQGREILASETNLSVTKIDVSNLTTGIYFVRLSRNGIYSTHKIIISH